MTSRARRPDPAGERSGVIVTPEAVVIDLATGGVATRLCSGLIDAAVRLGLILVPMFVLSLAGLPQSTLRTVGAFLLFFVLLGYPIVCEMRWRGRTVGKRATGLRVITVDGAPIRFRHAALRSMGGVADLLLPPGGITGLLFVWGTARNQRIGDLLAGTIVVRDARLEERSQAYWFPVPPGFETYAESIDPTPMTQELYSLVRAYLLRVNELGAAGRAHVAGELAAAVEHRLGLVRPQWVPPDVLLLCAVARFQRQRLRAPAR